jgi:sec-independent protein translocase protein TatC
MLKKLKLLKGKFRYDDSEMPFLEHLDAFRTTAIRTAIALVAGVCVCLPFADHLIAILRAPAEPYIEKTATEVLQEASVQLRIPVEALNAAVLTAGQNGTNFYTIAAEIVTPVDKKKKKGVIRLQFSEPSAAIKMWLTVSFFGGLLISLPFIVFIIGSFVMPGVRAVERKVMSRIAFFSGGLFLTGIAMGYKVTLPLALGLMLKIGGSLGGESIWFYNKYITFALQLLLGFGLAFQLPVVIIILGKMGLVNSTQLREKRRHVIVGLLILAMVLTPPDIMTQMLMAAPLILLYEFCIWFLHFSGNREASPVEEDEEQEEVEKREAPSTPNESDVAGETEQEDLNED